jgi:pimeloyl-ACP methyl ester carboxylesterase
MAHFVQDLETVVDAAGLERFSLLGVSQGSAVSIAYAVRHPERVARLVLYGGFAAGWAHGSETTRARKEAMITLTEHGWGQDNPAYRQLFASLFVPDADEGCRRWFNELQRVSTSPANAVRLQRAIGELDVRALLPQVAAPTLVLHVRDDAMVPFATGRLAAEIPGARFVPLPGRNHLLLEHDPGWERFLVELRAFLSEDQDGGEIAGGDAADAFGARLVTGGALAGALGAELARGLDRPSPGAGSPSLPAGARWRDLAGATDRGATRRRWNGIVLRAMAVARP